MVHLERLDCECNFHIPDTHPAPKKCFNNTGVKIQEINFYLPSFGSSLILHLHSLQKRRLVTILEYYEQ